MLYKIDNGVTIVVNFFLGKESKRNLSLVASRKRLNIAYEK